MEFGLLGEVEVRIGGRVVDVGHARQQCVLAALLLDANRPVPVDVLVERAWADQVPLRARNAVAGYISRLRQVLAGTDVSITGRQGGYVLTVDPLAVDVHRFDHLVDRARSEPEAAAGLLTEALALWRGEPFATLDTPWLTGMRSSLAARRMAAVLDRNDLALEGGRHAELLAELDATAAEFPLDERLAGQLILALYRCGRQADALLRYEQVRVRLAEELGTDPGPGLRLLHKQILTADAALTTTSSAVRPVPRQLPAPPRSFAGRDRELAALDATTGVAVVSGTAGVGKTALAVQWAHRVAARFPDGQLYVNLRGFDPNGVITAPGEVIRGFLDALEVAPQRIPAGLDAQAGLYRSLLADRRMLIVLDNARDADQVRPLLPGSPGCLVLVTSRNRLAGLVATDAAHPLTLDLLSTVEAHGLLADRLGPARLAAEPHATNEIITRCAGLPLALTIVAARAACTRFPLAAIADELREAHGGLEAFDSGDPATDIRMVFSWSYHALGSEAARLFRLLGLHPGPDVSVSAAASLTATPQVRSLLAELTRAHLLTEHLPGRYVFHDLLRAYATELVRHDTDAERHAATGRLLDHYVHTAHAAARLLSPARDAIAVAAPQPGVCPDSLTDHRQALSWFTAEHRVLLAAVDHAAAGGFDAHTWYLAWTMVEFLDWQGHWPDLAAIGHAALAAARRLADPLAQSHAHRYLARASTQADCLDDAHTHLLHGLDVAARAGESSSEARAHRELAYVYERQGHHDKALHHTWQALDLYRTTGHQRGYALALNAVGWYHALLGAHEQALTHCQEALTLLQELDHRDGQASTWDSLGYIHHQLGHHDYAIACYQRSHDLFQDLGDRYWAADVLVHLGDTYRSSGDLAATQDAWQRALGILDDLDHPDADAVRAKLHQLRPGVA